MFVILWDSQQQNSAVFLKIICIFCVHMCVCIHTYLARLMLGDLER